MNMSKKIYYLLIATMMALNLFGCKKTIRISSEVPTFTEIVEVAEPVTGVETGAIDIPDTTAGTVVETVSEETEPEEIETNGEVPQPSNASANAVGHSHKWSHRITAPTCTAAGYTTHTCSCGATEVDSNVDAMGHTWGPWRTVTEATETAAGQAKKVCSSCKVSESRILDKLPSCHKHSYISTVTKASSCSSSGIKTFTCSCGDSYTEDIVKLDHKYADKTVPATCQLTGYVEHTCSVCGNSYRDNYTKVLEHDYKKTVRKPTCTEGGYTTYKCNNCGDTYEDNTVAATGHSWSDWKTTKEATEKEAGVNEKTCGNCKAKETTDIPKLNHTHKYSDVITKPTCTADGYTTHTCSGCGDSYVDSKVTATCHSWGDWKVTKEATESSTGVKERICGSCKEKDTATTPKLDHSHNYTSVVTKPTCTEEGYTTYTCGTCRDSYVDKKVSATGHSYTHTVTKPTCTADGYTLHRCSICKTSYTDTNVSAKGHSWGDWTTITPATETSTGLTKRTCNVCGDSSTKTLDKLSHTHNFATTVDYKVATCNSEGYNTKACSCGETQTETLPKTHNWVQKHTDEVGHYDVRIVCHCGSWSSSPNEDYISSFAAHLDSIPIEYRYEGHSYYDTAKWIVDVPAKDWEECSSCGIMK